MKRVTFFVLFLLCSLAFGQCPIIPAPSVYQAGTRQLNIASEFSIDPANAPVNILKYLTETLNDQMGIRVVHSTAGRQLEFKRIENVPQDSYSISVNERIIITYSSEASCFYAINSLIQLIQVNEQNYFIDECFVQDSPRFQWRGLHLDVSRHFFSVDEVKRYIDLMAFYKFNVFHWHLTDDQGWRIEILKYPKLTSIGSRRDSTLNGHYSMTPHTYSKDNHGGYYTQDQIREVVAYAQNKYITIVPEIEMPGHARAALAAYPELSCTGKQQNVPGLWGIFDDIFCSKPETITFLQDVLTEVLELFPSEYIHIGGDEAPKTRWHECKVCQKNIKDNNLKDEHELQSYFIRQMDEFLTKNNRKLIGWDEILEGGLSPNASVMSWRGFDGGIEAAKLGHNVVMSPGSHCYFDHYQSKNASEPIGFGGYTPLEKVYEFDPVPSGFTPQQATYVLGGQANLWTEYIPTMSQLEYMAYPRALALSQALWCTNKPSFEQFKEVFIKYHIPSLKARKVNFSMALFYPKMKINRNKKGLNISFQSEEDDHFDVFIKSNDIVHKIDEKRILKETDSLYFERNQGPPAIIDYNFKVTSEKLVKPANFTFSNHSSIGLPIELITKPSEKYNYGGDLTLVDGIFGVEPWKGHEWLGYQSDTIEFIVDLESKKKMVGFQLNFLKNEGSWIYLPDAVQLQVSKNKKHWKKLRRISFQILFKGGITVSNKNTYVQSISKKGRYLKVLIFPKKSIPQGNEGAGQKPWTFIDELTIICK
ncbi:MAG: beta-N-acetylhexosaminidase [Crocinitomicaceae bacterium]|nr:beta-N-acetylhexosaminidase [Crocinitomicaceae bacterium]MDP4798468.1 beta-N-acetylhexosaminidase [Crocinitomicaceae bacterium]MDP4865118.1 beta-N-acetylhexosaminidase [Crocinitomicaceae bacterium]